MGQCYHDIWRESNWSRHCLYKHCLLSLDASKPGNTSRKANLTPFHDGIAELRRPTSLVYANPLSVLSPLVLPANLLLFLRGEVIGNVECLSDLLGRLALDHVGNSLAANV